MTVHTRVKLPNGSILDNPPSPYKKLTKVEYMDKFEDYLQKYHIENEYHGPKDAWEKSFELWLERLDRDDWVQLSALFRID